MKTYSLKSLSTFLVLCLLLILPMSCELDDPVIQSPPEQNSPFRITPLTAKELTNKTEIAPILKRFNDDKAQKDNRNAASAGTDLYVDTSFSNYLESTDGSFHSYSFGVVNLQDDDKKNIVVSLQPDDSYKVFLVTYDIADTDKVVTYQEIDLDANDFLNKSVYCTTLLDYTCLETQTTTYCTDCDNPDSSNTWTATECVQYSITSYTSCTQTNGGSGLGGNSDNQILYGDSSTGSGFTWGSGSGAGFTNGGTFTEPADASLVVFNAFVENNLTADQQAWLNSIEGFSTREEVKKLLEDNFYSNDTKIAVLEAIISLMSYSPSNYPGMNNGYPFNWWNDEDFIINSGNFDIDDEQPNAKEALLFSIFAPQAIQHIENSITALNKAEELVDTGVLTGINNGKADAFRHAFWNALGTAEFGAIVMKLFADAHEFGETVQLEIDMDFHNNHEGREIGSDFGFSSTDSDISDAIFIALLDGVLKYISAGVLIYTNE